MGYGDGLGVAEQVEGDDAVEVLLDDTLPGVAVTPPLKLVALVALALGGALSLDVDAGVVAELELDGVGRLRRRWWGR